MSAPPRTSISDLLRESVKLAPAERDRITLLTADYIDAQDQQIVALNKGYDDLDRMIKDFVQGMQRK